jgi:hypothetical protein
VTRIFSQELILEFPTIYYRRSRLSLRKATFLISRAIPVPVLATPLPGANASRPIRDAAPRAQLEAASLPGSSATGGTLTRSPRRSPCSDIQQPNTLDERERDREPVGRPCCQFLGDGVLAFCPNRGSSSVWRSAWLEVGRMITTRTRTTDTRAIRTRQVASPLRFWKIRTCPLLWSSKDGRHLSP